MNPEQNQAPASVERQVGVELNRAAPELNAEKATVNTGVERAETAANPAAQPIGLPPVQPGTAVVADDNTQPAAVVADAPTTAKDADKMEKEWSQKIQQTLSSTKGDPYKKEEGIKALRADYMFKRYGRKIGDQG
jgi:hypothetical protein